VVPDSADLEKTNLVVTVDLNDRILRQTIAVTDIHELPPLQELAAQAQRTGDPEKMDQLARAADHDPHMLKCFAWDLLTQEPKRPEAALPMALRAAELTHGQSGVILDTLALALHDTGHYAEAVAVQKRAVQLAPDEEMHERLKQFEQSLKKQNSQQ
jgi:tetratricopeptide (TPR) repeat protein